LEQFKETHKNYDTLTMSQHTTEDLRRDIENMENEKEQISKRLDRLKKKVLKESLLFMV
jgi:intraflagellar transport protein 81